jgi:hypothetical protein
MMSVDGSLDSSNVPRTVPGKSDAEVAADLKERAKPHLLALLAISDEARKAGFRFAYATAQGPTGDEIITVLRLEKCY